MSDALKDANQKLEEIQKANQAQETSAAAQQSDNVAHALAGAGGGLLSMALTYVGGGVPLTTYGSRVDAALATH